MAPARKTRGWKVRLTRAAAPAQPAADRLTNEVEHGRRLAAIGAPAVWRWEGAAGSLRWERRAAWLCAAVNAGDAVLEIGCGAGTLARAPAARGARVTAVDVSPDAALREIYRLLVPGFTRWHIASAMRRLGFVAVSATPFDFVHPAMPRALVGAAVRAGAMLERIHLVREIAGSLMIEGSRPAPPSLGDPRDE